MVAVLEKYSVGGCDLTLASAAMGMLIVKAAVRKYFFLSGIYGDIGVL